MWDKIKQFVGVKQKPIETLEQKLERLRDIYLRALYVDSAKEVIALYAIPSSQLDFMPSNNELDELKRYVKDRLGDHATVQQVKDLLGL